MKAKIINQMLYDGAFSYVHGAGRFVDRILVDIESKNEYLVITPDRAELYAYISSKEGFGEDYAVVKEIELPDELVKEVLTFIESRNKFEALNTIFKGFINKGV